MAGMVAHAGESFDHPGDTRQGPQFGTKTMGASSLPQGLVDLFPLLALQLGFAPRPTGGPQRLSSSSFPFGVPPADTLPTYLQLPRDVGQG
jgi:hypothetical protein